MNHFEHKRICVYLNDVFEAQTAHDPHAVVLYETKIEWDLPDLRGHGPDIAVIFDVKERKNWSVFDVAEEETYPTLIIEVTVPRTRELDSEDKVDEYELAGVDYYVVIDTGDPESSHERDYSLFGCQMTENGYQPMKPNEHGWLWLEPVNVWIGLRGNSVECYDQAGQRIENYVEIREAYRQLKAEAEIEAR